MDALSALSIVVAIEETPDLAVARALADLSHRLIDAAVTEIGEFEGHPVQVRS